MEDDGGPAGSPLVPMIIKSRKRRENIRSRNETCEDNGEDVLASQENPGVKRPVRPAKNQLSGCCATTSRRKLGEPNEAKGGVEESVVKPVSIDYRSELGEGREAERDTATKISEIDTAFDQDAQAVFERQLRFNKEKEGLPDDGLYHGQSGYAQYIQKQDTVRGNAASNLVRQGPYRASANIRVTTRWDYQPDICKDYKETGFCGFGDSCKFVHDRTDYKSGWELERDYERVISQPEDKKKYEIDLSDEDKVGNGLPEICPICKDLFTRPVKTKCEHYFCETCALTNYRKEKRCFVCGAQTYGIFTTAKGLASRAGPSKGQSLSDETPAEASQDIVSGGKIINEVESDQESQEGSTENDSSE